MTCLRNSVFPRLNAVRKRDVKKARLIDPSKTFLLRKAFEQEMIKLFDNLEKELYKLIVRDDAFGLGLKNRAEAEKENKTLMINAPTYQYAFRKSSDKVKAFQHWLDEMMRKGILRYEKRGRMTDERSFWTDVYIDSAYKKGIERGIKEIYQGAKDDILDPKLRKKYVQDFSMKFAFSDDINAMVNAAFFSPIHADAVGLIYARTYTDLKGVTEQMSSRLSSVLAQGLAEGRNPRDVARDITKEVSIFKNRARTIARTEIIRAHHEANINVYEQAGIKKVKIQAEWLTARDDRVCPKCAKNDGRVYALAEIRGMIPAHPNCRCVALPVIGAG